MSLYYWLVTKMANAVVLWVLVYFCVTSVNTKVLLSVTVFVCHDKGNVFLYNKFTSICILEKNEKIL